MEDPEKKRARQARHDATEKGRARHERYNWSDKGHARRYREVHEQRRLRIISHYIETGTAKTLEEAEAMYERGQQAIRKSLDLSARRFVS